MNALAARFFTLSALQAAMLAAFISPASADPGPDPRVPADLPQKIQAYVEGLAAKDAFSGVVYLVRNGAVAFSGAFGMASKEYAVPNSVDTRFNLGSINKLMTQIAIMQLAERQKLSMTDVVGKFLPQYPNERVRQLVTIRELLNMQSGIGDFFGPEYMATPKNRIRTLADYLPLFASKPLLFAPGTDRKYSNGGYIVLGLIIERVSGESYYDYVKANIFNPAGMKDSGWFDRDLPTPDVATGYTRHGGDDDTVGGDLRNNIYTAPARGSSAGGGYSNARDLVKLAAALQEGKLLSAADASRFGGLGVAGGSAGISADLEIEPHSGYVLVVLSNYDPPAAEDVAKTIRGWLGPTDVNTSMGGARRSSAIAHSSPRGRRRP